MNAVVIILEVCRILRMLFACLWGSGIFLHLFPVEHRHHQHSQEDQELRRLQPQQHATGGLRLSGCCTHMLGGRMDVPEHPLAPWIVQRLHRRRDILIQPEEVRRVVLVL